MLVMTFSKPWILGLHAPLSPRGRGREAMTYGRVLQLIGLLDRRVRGCKSFGRAGEGPLTSRARPPHPVLRTTFSPRGEGPQTHACRLRALLRVQSTPARHQLVERAHVG